MYYGQIKDCDIANGVGVRVSLFVSGCRNRCQDCFQPETWDFCFGQPFTAETEERLLRLLSPDYIEGLSILGGDPMEPENQRCLLPFLRRVRENLPGKTVWLWTGYTLEALQDPLARARCEVTDQLLGLIDVLVDGPFLPAQKNIALRFRGSENQRILDLPRSLADGRAVLWQD